jgi:hypothetical protein
MMDSTLEIEILGGFLDGLGEACETILYPYLVNEYDMCA